MLIPDTVLQNRYKILRTIGKGGMGAVYLAQDTRLGNNVALKETFFEDEAMRRAFEHEARLLAGLRHPALPRVSDHFTENEGQFLVMEFIAGDDLETLLTRRNAPFPVNDVLAWAEQLLDALAYLHAQNPPVIHRDIKPQNLKLAGRQIILLDFGLAKGFAEGMSHTSNKSLYGYTPTYAPLEQMRNDGTDARSDIYALGATLYHFLTGTAPADALLRANAIIGGEIDPLRALCEANPNVPPAVARILHQALALHKGQRPADTLMFRQMLRNALRNANNGAPPAPTLLMTNGDAPRVTAPSDEETVLDVSPAQLSPANAGKGTAANQQGTTVVSQTRLPEQYAKRPATRAFAPVPEAAAAQPKQLYYGAAALLAALVLGVAGWAFTGRSQSAADAAQNAVPTMQQQLDVSSPMVTALPGATPDAAATPTASPAAQVLDANGQSSATPGVVTNSESANVAQPVNTPASQPTPYPQAQPQPTQQTPAQTQPTQAPVVAQQIQSAPPPVNQPQNITPPPLQQRDSWPPPPPNYPPPQPPWQPLPVGIVPRPGQGPMGPPPGPRRP